MMVGLAVIDPWGPASSSSMSPHSRPRSCSSTLRLSSDQRLPLFYRLAQHKRFLWDRRCIWGLLREGLAGDEGY